MRHPRVDLSLEQTRTRNPPIQTLFRQRQELEFHRLGQNSTRMGLARMFNQLACLGVK